MNLRLVHDQTLLERIWLRMQAATPLEMSRCAQQLSLLDALVNIEEINNGKISAELQRAIETTLLNMGRKVNERTKGARRNRTHTRRKKRHG